MDKILHAVRNMISHPAVSGIDHTWDYNATTGDAGKVDEGNIQIRECPIQSRKKVHTNDCWNQDCQGQCNSNCLGARADHLSVPGLVIVTCGTLILDLILIHIRTDTVGLMALDPLGKLVNALEHQVHTNWC